MADDTPRYRIDVHGPYRRHILVRDGVDIGSYATRDEAEAALAALRSPPVPNKRGR